MTRGKIHLITVIIGPRITAACGRDGRYDEDGYLVHDQVIRGHSDANCALNEMTYQMSATFDKSRVTCSLCTRRMK